MQPFSKPDPVSSENDSLRGAKTMWQRCIMYRPAWLRSIDIISDIENDLTAERIPYRVTSFFSR